jgi:hypothetical protein
MPYTKQYRTIVPAEPGTDVELLRWFARESFEKVAAGDFLRIVEYTEQIVDASEIPPRNAELMGRPLTDFQWWLFSAVASA